MALERIVKISPAYDRVEGYGQHGADLLMLVKDGRGVVQFVVSTGWGLPSTRPHWNERVKALFLLPTGTDVGYHSRVPRYEGQTAIEDSCKWLDGAPCYYDGSSLAAEELFETLIAEGDEAVWTVLERRHAEIFGPEKE